MTILSKTGFKTALAAVAAGILPASANAATLAPNDYVGISFWLISMALIAATAFFFIETTRGESPTVYRYIDWLITVPLLMVEFYLILRAITKVSIGIFWRLMIGTVVMLVGGYAGEIGYISATLGFIIGMLGWAYILYEIFAGEASKVAANEAPASVQSAFSTMRWVVSIGWAIYPLGYFMGYMNGAVSDEALNIIYNFADVWNKIAFGVIIWNVAVTESETK